MPPFRSGLLKRKAKVSSSKVESNKERVENEVSSGSEVDEDLIQVEIKPEGDATDSENEEENSAASDEEQDEVLYQDEADSTFGDEEEAGSDGDGGESSDLEDSDASDSDAEASDNLGENEDNHAQDETEDDEVNGSSSEAESGLGQTSGSESDKKPPNNTKHKQFKSKQNTKTTQKKQSKSKESSKTSIDRLTDSIQKTSVTPVVQKEEYESGDSSDEEERVNTAGDVPAWWYAEYAHAGYDLAGRRLLKPPQRDLLDDFLKKCEDPEFWRTVRDPSTGQDVILSKQDLELIHRIREGRVPNSEHDEYKPWVEWFTSTVLATPVRAFPEHKRSFLPSQSERAQVARLAHALKMGWLKTRKQLAQERRERKEKKFYNLWGSTGAEENPRGVHRHIPAPRRALPAHAESYNPPPEYLLDGQEMEQWDALAETPWKRKYTFLPTQYGALRRVPAYSRFLRERFLRCLDLYLAPRAIKMRLTISAEELVPRLPSPRDLQPFPTSEALVFRGHASLVRSADFDPSGQYVVSGSDDGTLKVWETSSGRCLRTIVCGEAVARVAWIPVAGLSLVAVAAGARLLLLNPGADIGCHRVAAATDDLLEAPPPQHDVQMDERTSSCVSWDKVSPEEWARGVRLAITHFKPVTHVCWHARGDYACVTLRDAASRSVVVHQVSRRRSQLPFSRAKGLVQCAVFHPTKPILFVAVHAARGAHVRPGAAGAGAQAAGGRAVHLVHGAASRRRQPARRLVRPQVCVVRPGAVGEAVPDTAAARRRGALGGLPQALPAVRVRRRRRAHRRLARHGLQRPPAEPAAGAAARAGGGRRARRAARAAAGLPPDAAVAAGRRRRRHAAPLLLRQYIPYLILLIYGVLFIFPDFNDVFRKRPSENSQKIKSIL